MALHVLNDADVAFVRNLRERVNDIDRPVQSTPPLMSQAMQTHVAQAMEEIPALTLAADDVNQEFDEPGIGECKICGIFTADSMADPETVNALNPEYTQNVYNLSTSVIAEDDYFIIQRDKFGNWVTGAIGFSTCYFELKDDLTAGGSATAYLRSWDSDTSAYITDTTEANEFEVYDELDTFSGDARDAGPPIVAGNWGIAFLANSGHWEIMQLSCAPGGS